MKLASKHPTTDELAAFLNGRLSVADQRRLEEHVADCAECGRVLAAVPQDTLLNHLQDLDTVPSAGASNASATDALGPGGRRVQAAIPAELKNHPRYEVVRFLGYGGMGAVYLAKHRLMERLVALKTIRPDLLSRPGASERFVNEGIAGGALAHPNIVAALDAEHNGDLHFLVTEYVDGVSLAKLVESRGPLPPLQACDCIRQAALGLQHAFEKGMVHRDIKPQNLMINDQGQVKILDFGLARLAQQQAEAEGRTTPAGRKVRPGLTAADVILGTPDYIAPEQTQDSRAVDTRADIYALGCTLYFLLSGRPPFAGATLEQKLAAHCDEKPLRLRDVPEGLRAIMARMMAKDPARRQQTPAEVATALAEWAQSDEVHRRTAEVKVEPKPVRKPTPKRPAPAVKRGTLVALAGACLALPLVIWGGVVLFNGLAKKQEQKQGLGADHQQKPEQKGNVAAGQRLPVLIVLAQQFQHAGYAPVREALERDGWPVKIASSSLDECIALDRPKRIAVQPDFVLDAAVMPADYAGMVIPGGNIFMFKDEQHASCIAVRRLLNGMAQDKKCIAAIDSGMVVLAAAKFLEGKKASQFNLPIQRELIGKYSFKVQWLLEPVVRDGWLVTAANKEDSAAFAQQVIQTLKSR